MSTVAVLLIGTGAIAGIIKNSTIKDVIIDTLARSQLGDILFAPISGILMSAATASTTAGATIASSSLVGAILAAGVSAVCGAALINVGATMLDHLPHGSFFHATSGATRVRMGEALRLIPLQTLIGFILTLCSVATYLILK